MKVARRGGEVASCREAEDAEALRVELQLLRAVAEEAQRALRILVGVVVLGETLTTARHSVFQDRRGEAQAVEPAHDARAFVVDREDVVAPTGDNEDARARLLRFALRGDDGQARLGDPVEEQDLVGDRRGASTRGREASAHPARLRGQSLIVWLRFPRSSRIF